MTSGWIRIVGLATALIISACTGRSGGPQVLTDAQILTALSQRAGAHACCFYRGRDQAGRPIYGQLNGARELHFLVRTQVNDEAVACGWSGFAAPHDADGRHMTAGPDTVFIVRNGRIYLQEDLSANDFDRWQDELCGAAWIKPLLN